MANIKTITITEDVSEIVRDVLTKAYLTGQTKEFEGANYKQASNMQGSNNDEDRRQIIRSIESAFTSLKNFVAENLIEDNTESNNNYLSPIFNDEELTLTFTMPANYNNTAVDSLADNIHAYLVSMALTEWFAITSKPDMEIYESQSAKNLINIKRALYRRRRPHRPIKK